MHGSKQRLYSITSSARTSSVSGTVKSRAFELFSRNEAPMARLYWQHDPMKARWMPQGQLSPRATTNDG